MTQRFLLLCLLLLLPSGLTADGGGDAEALFRRFREAARFDYNYPRERVYLHLDNNAYVEGETIWFKAYVMRASSLAASALSRVLYVELLNADGELMERKLLRVENGQAAGEFSLEQPVRSGYYEIRAYTREMLNWGAAVCFSRVVPVFRRAADGGPATPLTIDRPMAESDLAPSHARPYRFPQAGGVNMAFFPEGGNRVKGLAQRIAFSLTDDRGRALADSCELYGEDGTRLAAFRPQHEGMGVFTAPAVTGQGHVVVYDGEETRRFDLPAAAASGYVMTSRYGSEGCSVVVERSAGERPRLLGLLVMCRDQVCHFDTLTVTDGAVELLIPRAALRTGVNRIELFDADGRSLCSRLLFKRGGERNLRLDVRQNEERYASFAPVALEMHLSDAEGRPARGTFSLAVRDAGSELVASPEASLNAELLLASEVKGYVARPEYYFEADDADRDRALDLLLMVQGWTANDFETLCGAKPMIIGQPIEEKLTLDGRILHDNDKQKPRPGAEVGLFMYTRAGAAMHSRTVTDSVGGFTFVSEEDYTGRWIGQFSITEEGKNKWSRVALNRWFDPAPRPFAFGELELTPPDTVRRSRPVPHEDLFAWTDTLPTYQRIDLGTAEVTTKNRYRGLTGNRYSYQGGEKAGAARARLFYNVERELERRKDEGRGVPYIWDFLKEKNEDIYYEYATDTIDPYVKGFFKAIGDVGRASGDVILPYYKGRPAVVFLDNDLLLQRKKMDNGLMLADEIKSAVIIESREDWEHFLPSKSFTFSGSDIGNYRPAAIFLYSNPDFTLMRTKKGVEKRIIYGFSIPKRFYSPNYRGIDLPTADDVRRTLYWNPSVTADEAGKATAVFFNNAHDGTRLRISARGVTSEGRFVSYDR